MILVARMGTEYIGKTDRTLFERTSEHAWADKASCEQEHIQFNHIFDILRIDCLDGNEVSEVDKVSKYCNLKNIRLFNLNLKFQDVVFRNGLRIL